jgi:hypothetical protein
MAIMYHGSSQLFEQFDLSHVLEGDGKVKFGYGVYLTTHFESAAHYSGLNGHPPYYVYSVEIPELNETNSIAFKQPVHECVVRSAEERLHLKIPESVTLDGKTFRKFLAKTLSGSVCIEGEKAASEFLDVIGVNCIVWPYNWRNAALGVNCAVFNADKIRIVEVHQVELDAKKKYVPDSKLLIQL